MPPTPIGGVTAHGPRRCVIDGTEAARSAGADLLVAIGGGSVIDAAKVTQLCLRHDIRDPEGLSAYSGRGRGDPSTRPADADRWIRIVAIPTTLSAAGFTWFGGASDPERGVKELFAHPMMIPQVVIMDPAIISRHCVSPAPCRLYPRKRTSPSQASALDFRISIEVLSFVLACRYWRPREDSNLRPPI
jgi:alcohol dehydrogenase YqhD (iron-dependent ADH family)